MVRKSRKQAATMQPSFESLYDTGVFGGTTSAQQAKRPNFLSAIGTMMTRSVKPLSPRSQSVGGERSPSRSSISHSRSLSRSNLSLPAAPPPPPRPVTPPTWKRRGQIPDMEDYLSLSQLESVWQYQDSHVGPIDAPLTAKSYSFQEIAEAPTIVKRKHHQIEDESDVSSEDASSEDNSHPDDAVVVDGVMHPALRPVPYLDNRGRHRNMPPLPKLQIPNAG